MGSIINLSGDRHQDTQKLLPWYVTGRLDPAERAEVDAHLDECETCRAELQFDRSLDRAIGETPLDVERGWAAMRRKLESQPAPRTGRALSFGWLKLRSPSFGWALAAQAGLLVITGALLLQFAPARYNALGAAPADSTGNLVVIFRPDADEQAIRALLRANGARMVDGPTAADAYVLHVAPAGRTGILERLRNSAEVVLAEPIDAGALR